MLMELRPTLGSPNSISHITWTRTGGIPLYKLLDNALYDLAESQGHQMRDLPLTPRNRPSGRLPSTHPSIYKNPSPEESRSSRMSMSWIPGFILVLIHHGIFGIYKNILGEGS
ncbi:hypothetical protein Ddye_012812 [Dipteronia dyeriana]|uniref:Uncharacterized protein n=1 Tax=Dipteronia dyeriana TaxID=168575 RepID=A0AAD9X590_9ROSI|nr:hypothetical protein Ddye_012812 [Dipteronia dyeriana]